MKKYIKCFTAMLLTVVMTCALIPQFTVEVEAAKTVAQLEQERKQLESQTKNAKAQLEEIRKKQVGVEEEVDAINKMLNSVQAELLKAEEDLEEINGRLADSEAALAEAEVKKEEQMELFGKRIKFFYEQGDIGYIDIIFQADSFSDMLKRAQYVQDIMEYDNKMLENLKESQRIIKEKTELIKLEKEAQESVVAVRASKQAEVKAAMDEKTALLASYEKDEKKYEQMIKANEKRDKEVQQLINEAKNPAQVYYTGGQLNWPVPSKPASSSSLSSGFVNRKSPITGKQEKHTGYDIPAPYGSAIVAAEAGTVIYSGWMNGYGNTIMINHGNNLVTLYAHNSSLVVSKGTTVKRGQQVAKCGSTGWSTGNHCHFEVRLNGTAVSPEPYLGIKNVGY
ncbi:MAG: peptidoglycan DD-metalloendopeptidase family protein [Firmicutes bacterium]|nr:peptidoglycan DD-metalloendopeptidase family protein [Bacillota bacterium]